ncbi:radial spoke 3 [Paraphysoderma sedebokerense]|nr:radial spoke 3 [Paraphysoderma sedebokerense]
MIKSRASTGTYAFSTESKTALGQKPKYRDPNAEPDKPPPANIMYDRRIYRGSTYASPVSPNQQAQPNALEIQKQNELRRRLKARKKAELQRRPKTPDAVQGRQHIEIQTELYLEEFSDKIPESYASTQTDAFLDRPPSPLYIPQKSGVDVETQILEGDLFDFDREVEPLLEILVGKTLEQSLMEVSEESELECLRKRQKEFLDKRNAELVEVQRLEEAERRRVEEKERRKAEARQLHQKKKEEAAKLAAKAFAESYLSEMFPTVMSNLTESGYIYDPVQKIVEQSFLPWLTNQVEASVEKIAVARKLVDDLISKSLHDLQSRRSAASIPV